MANRHLLKPNEIDELTITTFSAIQSLPPTRKARLLLDTSLSLITAGQYGAEVENFLEVYLRTPNLDKGDIARALVARGNARKAAGDILIAKAQQDFEAALRLDPTSSEIHAQIRKENTRIHLKRSPPSQRSPPEIWHRIACYIPRYHLRTWLSVSGFHRSVALPLIFHTVDLYFGEDSESSNRGLDILERVKSDPGFARRVKVLRLHWSYEEGDMLDLMARIFRTALPAFNALREFEWIGYPEMRTDMVQAVLASHPNLESLGLIGWHFDAVGVSAFRNLRKFTLRAEDDDGYADMGEVRTVLDQNSPGLRHLCLGAYLNRDHSWDSAFQSITIKNLTHLDLVDTRISHVVFARIAHAHNLQSLTLHGTFEEPGKAGVVFESDHVDVTDRQHTFLPHLEAFRFVLVAHDDELELFQAVTQFLRGRKKLRRLDLGNCPWELVRSILQELVGLRVLRVRIANFGETSLRELVSAIPEEMVAIHLATVVSDKSLNEYAKTLSCFSSLSFLHMHNASKRRPQSNKKEIKLQTDTRSSCPRSIAEVIPSLDFVGWHGEHYVVVRTGKGVIELKDLPSRRRLDCGNGVDLGSEDAGWLERKDVPMDYEMSGLES